MNEEEYIYQKWIKGRGACYSYSENKPIKIDWIYKKNKLQIYYYNLVLFFRFYWRKLKNGR